MHTFNKNKSCEEFFRSWQCLISLASVEFGVIKIVLCSDSVHVETVSDSKLFDLASTNQMYGILILFGQARCIISQSSKVF